MGLLMAAILGATMLGLVYLTQTLGSNAATSEISDLAAKGNKLGIIWRNQTLTVEIETDAAGITKRARKLGLKPLGEATVFPAP